MAYHIEKLLDMSQKQLDDLFSSVPTGNIPKSLLARFPPFQVKHGYPPEEPGKADLAIGANYVAETFGCLSLTLEQPFKDIGEQPEDEQGWCPRLSGELGAACLFALGDVADALR